MASFFKYKIFSLCSIPSNFTEVYRLAVLYIQNEDHQIAFHFDWPSNTYKMKIIRLRSTSIDRHNSDSKQTSIFEMHAPVHNFNVMVQAESLRVTFGIIRANAQVGPPFSLIFSWIEKFSPLSKIITHICSSG